MHVAESRSTLCNKNVDPSHYSLCMMYRIWIGLQCNVWLGHDTITTMGSLVVKGLLTKNCGHVCIVGDYSTHLHVRRTGITVWLGLIFISISVLKGIIILIN